VVSKLSAELSILFTISFPEKELIRSLVVCKKEEIALSLELVLLVLVSKSSVCCFKSDLFDSNSSPSSSSMFTWVERTNLNAWK